MNNPNLTKGATTVRKRRVTFPQVNNAGDDAILCKYRVEGARIISKPVPLDTTFDANLRLYVAGNPNGLRRSNDPGINVTKLYSTYLYKPGTKVRWEPTCGSTTSGRVVYAWADNPEKIHNLRVAYEDYFVDTTAAKKEIIAKLVTGIGNCRSFPVWMETEIQMPTDTRRKRFDTDVGLDLSSTSTAVNTIDRVVQKALFYYIDGNDQDVTLGSMWYHDVVHVQGLNTVAT